MNLILENSIENDAVFLTIKSFFYGYQLSEPD